MLQQDEPDDFVIATGEMRSVREFVEEAFGYAGLDWEKYVEVDPGYFKPTEVDKLVGDPFKAAKELNWIARTKFKQFVHLMVEGDRKILQLELKGQANNKYEGL